MRERTRQRFQSSQQGVEMRIYDRWILKLVAAFFLVVACAVTAIGQCRMISCPL
jgi:hypothetical protein